jgi:hypothetical protein
VKASKLFIAIAGAVLLVSSAALAAEVNKATVRLEDKVTVDGKSIDSGKYLVEWNGNGPDVQVTLVRGKDTVAQFSAHIAEQGFANAQDAYGTTTAPDGTKALTAIYPGKKRIALQVAQSAATQQSSTSPSR